MVMGAKIYMQCAKARHKVVKLAGGGVWVIPPLFLEQMSDRFHRMV